MKTKPDYPGGPMIEVGDWVVAYQVMEPQGVVAPTKGQSRERLTFVAKVLDVVDPYIENNQPDAPIRYLVRPLGFTTQTIRMFQPDVVPIHEYNIIALLEGWPTIEAPGGR